MPWSTPRQVMQGASPPFLAVRLDSDRSGSGRLRHCAFRLCDSTSSRQAETRKAQAEQPKRAGLGYACDVSVIVTDKQL